MATAKKKPDIKAALGYLQNRIGRVFVATPELHKQFKKGKLGLMKINKSTFDEAMKNGGMGEAEPDFEKNKDEI